MELDVDYFGMLFSNIVMFFIILTAGTVLLKGRHSHKIETVGWAHEGIRIAAGRKTFLLSFFLRRVIVTGFSPFLY